MWPCRVGSLSLVFLFNGACTSVSEDSAAAVDSDTPAPDTDFDTGSGPEPFADCTELHWRTEAELLLTSQEQVDAFCFEWNAIDGSLTIDLDGDPDSPIWEGLRGAL